MFKYLFNAYVCVYVWKYAHAMMYTWKKKRTLWGVRSPSTTQVLGTKLRLPGFVEGLYQLTTSPVLSTLHRMDSCKRELSADCSESKCYFHLIVINVELRLLWWNTQHVYSAMNFFSPNGLFPTEWVSVIKIFWPLVQVIAILTWALIKWYCGRVLSNLHKTICNFHFDFWHFLFL